MISGNDKQARSILEAFPVATHQNALICETAIRLCLENERSFDTIKLPLTRYLRMREALSDKSQKIDLERVRKWLEPYVEKQPETTDRINLTWFQNTGSWLFL